MLYIPSYAPYGVQEEKNEMNMNQYGNNLIAPYGQNDYSPFFNGRRYQDLYRELFSLGKIADCKEIDLLISDVKNEIFNAEQYHLEKISTNYDMIEIINEQ